jgi:hypothetical protein
MEARIADLEGQLEALKQQQSKDGGPGRPGQPAQGGSAGAAEKEALAAELVRATAKISCGPAFHTRWFPLVRLAMVERRCRQRLLKLMCKAWSRPRAHLACVNAVVLKYTLCQLQLQDYFAKLTYGAQALRALSSREPMQVRRFSGCAGSSEARCRRAAPRRTDCGQRTRFAPFVDQNFGVQNVLLLRCWRSCPF